VWKWEWVLRTDREKRASGRKTSKHSVKFRKRLGGDPRSLARHFSILWEKGQQSTSGVCSPQSPPISARHSASSRRLFQKYHLFGPIASLYSAIVNDDTVAVRRHLVTEGSGPRPPTTRSSVFSLLVETVMKPVCAVERRNFRSTFCPTPFKPPSSYES
jgi:hypothetical protein